MRSPEPATPIPRPAARVILLDAADRLLLFRFISRVRPNSWWVTPGGGLDPGETHRAAALRELREETGLTGVKLSRCVWKREHIFPWEGRILHQQERYFVARIDSWEVDTTEHSADELEVMPDHRWWTLAEIQSSGETFAPRRLGELLGPIIAGDLPARPLHVDP